MEYFDILDDEGNLTGERKEREKVHRDGDWHKAVHIWIVNDKGEIILQRRSENKKFSPNMWTTSASGHLSSGDTNITGAIREVEEEIGLKIHGEDLEYLFTVKESMRPKNGYIDNEFIDVYLVQKNVSIDSLKVQKEEVSEIKYLPYQKFREQVNNNDKNISPHQEIHQKLFEILDETFDLGRK